MPAVPLRELSAVVSQRRPLARTLCAAYNQEREELQDLESFATALEDLCGLRSVPVPASEGDAQLATAVAELRKQIG